VARNCASNTGDGTELNMFYPATGASKNLVPEKCDTLDSCWRQSTGTGNWHQKTGECVITIRSGHLSHTVPYHNTTDPSIRPNSQQMPSFIITNTSTMASELFGYTTTSLKSQSSAQLIRHWTFCLTISSR